MDPETPKPARTVLVIGIGAGDPEHVTVQAMAALARVDVVFTLDKGADRSDLAEVRREVLDRFGPAGGYRSVTRADPERELGRGRYADDVADWHRQRVDLYQGLIADELADGEVGAFLVWGDPALYDSTLRLLDQVAERGGVPFAVEVVPGISAVQVLAARFRVPLHGIGAPVHITTGRRMAAAWPDGVDQVVVMLDGRCAFADLEPDGVEIFWGAYLGTPDEILISGPLAEVAAEIVRVRAEARRRKGWMFDTYLLRRASTSAAED